MKTKKIPMRMCVGCGEMKPKKELIRIVTDSEGNTCVDLTGKKAGRGAYICRDTQCLKKAGKSKRIKVSDEIIAELEAVLADEQ
jgi:predicted RNA-binding protein YlxR (DUF448 family)